MSRVRKHLFNLIMLTVKIINTTVDISNSLNYLTVIYKTYVDLGYHVSIVCLAYAPKHRSCTKQHNN